MAGPRPAARHPYTPTDKWQRFQADLRKAALRGAAARSRTDLQRKRATEYAAAEAAKAKQGG